MGKKLMISLEDDDAQDGEPNAFDEDQAALEKYRQQRLRELHGSGQRETNSLGGAKKVFGHLREIGIEQFLNAVEGETDDVAVVLHLYEPVSRLGVTRSPASDRESADRVFLAAVGMISDRILYRASCSTHT